MILKIITLSGIYYVALFLVEISELKGLLISCTVMKYESLLYNLSTDSPNWFVGSEGWEKLGLYEYYRAKNAARKKKEDDILEGLRDRSRSPSPIIRLRSRSRSPPKKRYRRYHKNVLYFLPPVSLVTHKVT